MAGIRTGQRKGRQSISSVFLYLLHFKFYGYVGWRLLSPEFVGMLNENIAFFD
jgi:hypothetical protein